MDTATKLSDAHTHWLASRGIPTNIALAAGLVSKGKYIGFPYHRLDGSQAFVKWGGPDKAFWIEPSGPPLELWLAHRLNDTSSDTLIITEGEIDALSCMTANALCVVFVPNGARGEPGEGEIDPLDDRAFQYLWSPEGRLRPEIDRFERFILATDADIPGNVLRDELAIRLGRDRCWFVTYPPGCKDANDVLREHEPDSVRVLIDNAKPLVPDQLVKFSDIPRSVSPSYSSGWGQLDPHLMFSLPEIMVVSGPPNHGKSQWTLALVANLARVHGMRIAILQFEDDVDRHRDDLVRYAKAWRTSTGKSIDLPPAEWIDRHFLTVPPPETIEEAEDKTLGWLKDRIHEATTRHGCKVVVIDPWNEIEHAWGVNETETAYTGKALRQLRALARKYQILLIIVTHPTKAGGLKTEADEMSLYDISGSAHWANKTDHGVLIYRPKTSDVTTINVAKCRDFRKRGMPGTVQMRFNPRTATFEAVTL